MTKRPSELERFMNLAWTMGSGTDMEEDRMKDTNANWARRQIAQHGRDRYPSWESQLRKLVEEVGELNKAANRYEEGLLEDETKKLQKKIDDIRGEAADVALALYNFCDKMHFDLDEAIRDKVQSDVRKF